MCLYASSIKFSNQIGARVFIIESNSRSISQFLQTIQLLLYPLANSYVSMVQRLGLETGQFSTGKGTLRGLEMA